MLTIVIMLRVLVVYFGLNVTLIFSFIIIIITKFYMWGWGDVITDAKFYGNQLRSFGVIGPPPNAISCT